jgi:hypothetical protein
MLQHRFSFLQDFTLLDSVGLTLSLQAVWLCAPCCALSDGLIGVGVGQACGEWLDLQVGATVYTNLSGTVLIMR